MSEPQEGVAITPGMMVQPCPMVVVIRPVGGNVVFHAEHVTGATILIMPPDFAASVLAQLQAALVEVAQSGPQLIVPNIPVPRDLLNGERG